MFFLIDYFKKARFLLHRYIMDSFTEEGVDYFTSSLDFQLFMVALIDHPYLLARQDHLNHQLHL